MGEEGKRIDGWGKEAFLVYEKSLGKQESPIYEWLREEGFTFGRYKGNFGCPWIYINISQKKYAYGMPGISVVRPIGDHAITMEEFRTIYSIYKKYEGKEIFVFHRERFDC